jgi:hypothetical protein
MKASLKLQLAALLLAGWSLGCSSGPKPTASATPGAPTSVASATPAATAFQMPADWTLTKAKDGNLEMALPNTWVVADGNDPKFTNAVKDLQKSNPQLANIKNSGYYFMAIDTKTKDAFNDNVNVVQKHLPQTLPINDDSAQQLKGEFKKMMPLDGDLDIKVTRIPHGDAFRYTAVLNFNKPDGSKFQTYIVGHILFQGTDLYTITFSSTPNNKVGIEKIADDAMKSMKLSS